MKPLVNSILQNRLANKNLIEVQIKELEKFKFYTTDKAIKQKNNISERTHILSPFDPLIIQRKRLKMIFDYEHAFEAYIPKEKRKYGYFTLPVLSGNNIIALLDLKTDRSQKKVLIQNWVWLGKYKSQKNKALLENHLNHFEKFQLSGSKTKSAFIGLVTLNDTNKKLLSRKVQ